jgi:hypothetical protein
MTGNKIVSFKSVCFACIALLMFFSFKGEKDPLHKRIFNISLGESKDGVPAKKTIADKMYFKDGKVFTDFLHEKFGYNYIRYRINKDSIYTDSTNTEVRLLQVEASATDEDNQTVTINFEQVEWDIDGTVKITKNDRLKRFYDFVGREKGGKPKKEKKKKPEGEGAENIQAEGSGTGSN